MRSALVLLAACSGTAPAKPAAEASGPTELERLEADIAEREDAGAAVERRPDHVRHALMADPNTAATLPVERIWQLADAMVAAHGDLLPPELRAPLSPG